MTTRLTSLFLTLAIVGPIGAQPSPAELEYGRKKFDVWRQFPDRLAKLRQASETFAALPPARQEQLAKLDADLASESSLMQARLQNVLDRYTEWLASLPEKDRERINQAPDKAARLTIIKDLRQNEWLREQPKAVRDSIASLPFDARPAAISRARTEERKKQAEWQIARRVWDDVIRNRSLPNKLADFEPAVQSYVGDVLMRLLSKEERERLAKAEGNWPQYPQTLVELADKHPPALPSTDGPRSVAELPKVVRDSLSRKGVKEKPLEKKLKQFEGRYPEFAIRLTNMAANDKVDLVMPLEWWPFNFNCLMPPTQDFVKKKLEPLLDRKEARQLVLAEGKWPDYPETIQSLAQAHNLRVPWFTLPGGHERWDPYRDGPQPTVQGFPELPKYKLHDFVFFDLDDLDRIKFKNEIDRARGKNDAEAWGYIVDLYFQRYPGELSRLRQVDRDRLGLKRP